jgi:hypothetical protein
MQNSLQKIHHCSIGHLTLKTVVFLILVLGLKNTTSAQTSGSVGIGTTTPYANAILDITSTTKGVLLPRLSIDQRDVLTPKINATANGLMIYNTTSLRFNYWDGTKWNDVGAGASGKDGTVWYAGNGVPINSTGKATDFYLDNITGDVYQKDLTNIWVRFPASNPVNLKNTNKIEVADGGFNIPGGSSVIRTFAFAGAAVGNAAICSPSTALDDGILISYARVSTLNQIEVKFFNAGGTSVTISAGNYELAIVK